MWIYIFDVKDRRGITCRYKLWCNDGSLGCVQNNFRELALQCYDNGWLMKELLKSDYFEKVTIEFPHSKEELKTLNPPWKLQTSLSLNGEDY